ncbi:epiplakin-like [Monodon monoceros]|uniref:epiplakin-like n=1 Tax=Monodon monoceros TaxID=40151 RepID=UPI0010F9457A|nr:epiplakin-like [Monodon monoceros]
MRVASELACQQSLLDRETWCGLLELGPSSSAPGFLDPNTPEQLPYRELLGRCVQAPSTGLGLLPLKITFRTLSGAPSLARLLEVGVLDAETVQACGRAGWQCRMWVHAPRCSATRRAPAVWQGSSCCLQGTRASSRPSRAPAPHGRHASGLGGSGRHPHAGGPGHRPQLWLDEAVRAGLFGPELHRQLLAAEQVVTGYHGPFSGIRIPLFQAMKRELVDRPPVLRLLVAQLATGRLVCPARRLRLPLEATLHFGCLDRDSAASLAGGWLLGPRQQESLSCGQLLAHCVTDPETGLAFLPISVGSPGAEPQGPPLTEHSTWQTLRAAVATVSMGKFQGRPVSLWELLFSEAVPVEQRVTLSQQHKDGALLVEELAAALRATHEQAAATARTTFAG